MNIKMECKRVTSFGFSVIHLLTKKVSWRITRTYLFLLATFFLFSQPHQFKYLFLGPHHSLSCPAPPSDPAIPLQPLTIRTLTFHKSPWSSQYVLDVYFEFAFIARL